MLYFCLFSLFVLIARWIVNSVVLDGIYLFWFLLYYGFVWFLLSCVYLVFLCCCLCVVLGVLFYSLWFVVWCFWLLTLFDYVLFGCLIVLLCV